jgi:hypothetical protein
MGGPEGGGKLLKFTKKWRQVSLEVWNKENVKVMLNLRDIIS